MVESASPVDITVVASSHLPGAAALSCGSVVWRYRGALRATVVAKCSFDLMNGQPMRLRSPDDVARAEKHLGGDALRSVHEPADLVPYRQRADVTLVGHAYALGNTPTYSTAARLAVYRDQKIIEKAVNVFGDRDASGAVRAFQRIPLQPELALVTPDNPVGSPRPNLVDPTNPALACFFAPISRYWAPRTRLLRGGRPPPTDASMELSEQFDFGYFQAAPVDQQVTYLRGDEWLVIDGVHPTVHRLKTQVPAARVRARAFGHGPRGMALLAPLELVADGLVIDADRMSCSVVYRGSVPLEDERAVQMLKVYVALELGGEEALFPPPEAVPRPIPRAAEPKKAAPQRLGETMPSTNEPLAPSSLPFIQAAPSSRAPSPTSGQRIAVPSVAHEEEQVGATEVLRSADVARAIAARATPFAAKPTPGPMHRTPSSFNVPAAVSPTLLAEDEIEGTFAIANLASEDSNTHDTLTTPLNVQDRARAVTGPQPMHRAPAFGPRPTASPPPQPPPPQPPPPQPPPPQQPPPQPPPPQAVSARPAAAPSSQPTAMPSLMQPTLHQRATFELDEAGFDGTMDLSEAQMRVLMSQKAAPFVPAAPGAAAPPTRVSSIADEDTGDGRTSIITLDALLAPKATTLPFGKNLRHEMAKSLDEPSSPAPAMAPPPMIPPPMMAPPAVMSPPPAPTRPPSSSHFPRVESMPPQTGPVASQLQPSTPFAPTAPPMFDAPPMFEPPPPVAPPPIAPAQVAPPPIAPAQVAPPPIAPPPIAPAQVAPAEDVRPPTPAPEIEKPPLMGAIASKPETAPDTEARKALRARLGKPGSRFDGEDFRDADLSDLDFTGRSLARCNLRNAKMVGTILRGAMLTGADLSGADLTRAVLVRAALDGAYLDGATFDDADLSDASLSSSKGANVKLTRARGPRANLKSADLTGADLRQGGFTGASFDGATLKDAQGDQGTFDGASFVRSDLTSASFRRAKLTGANLSNAILEATDFRHANLERANVHGTNRKSAKLLGANTKGLIETAPPADKRR